MTVPLAAQKSPVNAADTAGRIWFDGELVPAAEAKVSVLTHALHYGTSVFEGIRAYKTARGPAVFRLPEHTQRLLNSAKILGMPAPYTAAEISEAVLETVRANGFEACYIRPLMWYGADTLGVNPGRNRVHFMVATMPWGLYLGEEAVREGAKLVTSSWRRSPGDVLPTNGSQGPVQTANSLPTRFEEGTVAYAQANRVHNWMVAHAQRSAAFAAAARRTPGG